MSLSAIPGELRTLVFQRDGGQCQYCHLRQIGQAAIFHINHIIPRSRGGATTLENLVLQCPHCSLHKSNLIEALDSFSGKVVRLFHPLEQKWSDHFQLQSNGICRGITPCGRATVEQLKMNLPLPRIARSIQIRLKLLDASAG